MYTHLRAMKRALLTGLFSSALTFSAYATTPEEGTPTQPVLPLEDLRVFTKAFEHISRAYVEELTDKQLLEFAIRGMIAELDPHSIYLDAEQTQDMQMHISGEFGGLGIEVGMEDGLIRVISPIDDTPADKAGIEAGDLIIKLNETSVQGLDLGEAIDLMRGEKGTEITLTIAREGAKEPLEITLVRDIIKVRSVRWEIISNHYGYIRIAQFQERTAEDVADAWKKIKAEQSEINGLVLDLRNNPGGVLQSSVGVVDHFIHDGLVVYTKGREIGTSTEFKATQGDITDGLPIVVLINGGSASASEIVAGALQDHKRAVVMGKRSFGKGSVQSIIPITEDKQIKITTAHYFTPSGRSIQAAGIQPDIELERVRVTAVAKSYGVSEAGLSGHLENPDSDANSTSDDSDVNTDLQNEDSQLFEAITLLTGISLYRDSLATSQATEDQEPKMDTAADDTKK